MSDSHHSDAHSSGTHSAGGHGSDSHHVNYPKIYLILLGLLVVSIVGPELGIFWVTLVTAFGVAVVKAQLVVQNFMHLKWEKQIMKWLLATSVILMLLMFAGISPDVMRHEGRNWTNVAALEATARGVGGGHGAEEGAVEMAEVVEVEFSAQSTYNGVCAACHGQAGDGAGPAGGALNPRPANFTDPAFWATRDEARVFNAIKNGAASVGGSPLMVPFGANFNDEQIQALVEYIETFRPSA